MSYIATFLLRHDNFGNTTAKFIKKLDAFFGT